MDIETTNNLFQPATHSTATPSQGQLPTFSTPCSLYPLISSGHTLTLIANALVLQHPQEPTMVVGLTFELKFEVLREEEKNVCSAKIGIRLYDQLGASAKLYLAHAAEAWVHLLQKRLNQRGFHEMFKPIRKLGKGNFATVYEAQRITDKVRFAVKAFSKQNSYSAKNGKESLVNELTVLRELNKEPHPNVLKLEAVFQSDNSIYVVLQLLPGQTLFQAIQERKGHFSTQEVKAITGGLLAGLRHIHSNRVMHRDLKPENIMLRGKGNELEPVIVDFGLASNVDLPEYLFFRCGTPGYVAPEIIKLTQSQHVEPGCDVFSLGAIFHVLLVRRPLFEGTRYDQVYRNNKAFNFVLDGEHFKEVEPQAKHLLTRMLHLDPTFRISAADSLAHPYFVGEEIMLEPKMSSQSKVGSDSKVGSQLKVGSPILTETGSRKQKRKKLFLFF